MMFCGVGTYLVEGHVALCLVRFFVLLPEHKVFRDDRLHTGVGPQVSVQHLHQRTTLHWEKVVVANIY